MGLFSSLLPAIGAIGGNLLMPGIGGSVGGLLGGALAGGSKSGGSQQSGTQTVTQQNTLDPRIANTIFGAGGEDKGILGRNMALFDKQQDPRLAQFGSGMTDYLTDHGTGDMHAQQMAAMGLLGSNIQAPQMQAASMGSPNPMQAASMGSAHMGAATVAPPSSMQGAQVGPYSAMQAARVGNINPMQAASMGSYDPVKTATMNASRVAAPSQNGVDTNQAFHDMIYGAPGANPYLSGAIQGGINQSSNAFGDLLSGATRNLTENVLPGLRSGARVSGSYGGNREALAEGKALESFNTQMGQAANQFGQHNTDAAVGAQAGAYDADRSRALAAMGGLSGNQFGVASQDASLAQQASGANQQAANTSNLATFQADAQRAAQDAQMRQQANSTNFGFDAQKAMQDAQNQQGANSANFGAGVQGAMQNAQNQQQANSTNYGGLLTSAQQTAQNLQSSMGQNAGFDQQAGANNAGFQQQANSTNYGGLLDTARSNAGFQQQAGQTNLGASMDTNRLNSGNQLAGIGASGNVLNNAYGYAGNQDSYALNQAGKVNGLLSPYLTAGGGSTTSQPLYQNQAGNALAGATAGLGLAGQLGKLNLGGLFGGNSAGNGVYGGGAPGQFYDGYGWVS